MSIRIANGRLHIVFPNGYTISIINGPGSYSTNHDAPINLESHKQPWESTTMEAACMKEDGSFVVVPGFESDFRDDDVAGWKDSEWIARFIQTTANLEPGQAKPRLPWET